MALTCFHSHAAFHWELTGMTPYTQPAPSKRAMVKLKETWGTLGPDYFAQYHSAMYIKAGHRCS